MQRFTQRIDSEAAPANNGWNELVGVKDIECAFGSLAYNTRVPSGSSILVLEDVTVPSGKSLTLESGVIFNIDDYDQPESGASGPQNQITVTGRLKATGTNAAKVVFKSAKGSPAADDWYGITGSGKLLLEFVQVEHSQNGVNPSSNDTVKIEKSVFNDNLLHDMYVGAAPNPLLISRNVVTAMGSGINLACSDFSHATVSDNRVAAVDASSVAGILVDGASTPTGGITASADTVTDFTGGAGVQIIDSTPTFTNCRVTDNKYGFEVEGGVPLIGTSSSSSDNAILSNTRGIYVHGVGSPTCITVAPVIRNNLIDSNTYGIVTEKTASSVDVGTNGTTQKGLNTITNSGTYCIWNRANSSCGSVPAKGNYFGSCTMGLPPICWNGLVVTDTSQCSPPASINPGLVATEPIPPAWSIRVRPNPVEATTTVSFATSKPSSHVDLSIFDVSGRLVRTLASGDYPVGTFDVFWDGKSSDGAAVPEGIYFVRVLERDGTRHAAKIMVLR